MAPGHFAKTHVFRNDDLGQVLHTGKKVPFTKTKVCITMGPSLSDVDLVCDLLEAGATCARIDLTWQNLDDHRSSLRLLQEAMRKTRRLCAVMLDCMGRDILVRRTCAATEKDFADIKVVEGQQIILTADPSATCTPTVFPISYADFPSMVEPGDRISLGRFLATGADSSTLRLEVVESSGTEVVCVAQNTATLGGLLTVFHQERSQEGLSNIQNSMPVLEDWDKEAIAVLCNEFEVDFVTLSYCRSAYDVQDARDFLRSIGKEGVKVIAKCETRESILNFKSIATAADALIIARGNLGLDVAPEKMAAVQKAMLCVAGQQGKPTLVTRVVDSMANVPRPTRAEATDVANAVLDGADGIMLGAETYRGQYPLETVRTVAAICREAEAVFDHHNHFEHLLHFEDGLLRSHNDDDDTDYDDYYYEEEDPELPSSRRPSNAGMYRPGSPPPFPSNRSGSPTSRLGGSGSQGNLTRGISNASMASEGTAWTGRGSRAPGAPVPMTAKLESIASAAVKAADKVGAALIVCMTHTGRTASLIAKYRPVMPIMTLVVPYLKNEGGMGWKLEGRAVARQALITCGLLPVLAAPAPSAGETLLEEAILLASKSGLVQAHDHVVAVSLTASREAMVKVVSVGEDGESIKRIRPPGLFNLLRGPSAKGPPSSPQSRASMDSAASLGRTSVLMSSRSDALVPFDPLEEAEEVEV